MKQRNLYFGKNSRIRYLPYELEKEDKLTNEHSKGDDLAAWLQRSKNLCKVSTISTIESRWRLLEIVINSPEADRTLFPKLSRILRASRIHSIAGRDNLKKVLEIS